MHVNTILKFFLRSVFFKISLFCQKHFKVKAINNVRRQESAVSIPEQPLTVEQNFGYV